MLLIERLLDESEKRLPVVLPEKDERHFPDFLGLHERYDFEKLIEGAETAREVDIHFRGVRQHDFAHEEVVETEPGGEIGVVGLRIRQVDIESD